MNEKRLSLIFKNYIEKFDYITYNPHYEIYKWEIAHDFRSLMDDALGSSPDAMLKKMKEIVKRADNLLTNEHELPGAAICDYIEREPEKVRTLLQQLFTEDGGNLDVRQRRINDFINACSLLKDRYFPDSYKYRVGQRAVMVLLGLYDPENNYLYKPSQATEFADCAEFYEDFGPSTDFKLPVYYRMCDQLVTAIRNSKELMAKHMSRYDHPKNPLHEDKALHILAFDIIYSGTRHHLYNNIEYTHISTSERKKYLENCEKAEMLANAVDKAQADFDLYKEAIEYYSGILPVGAAVKHRSWGEGTVFDHKEVPSGHVIRVAFPDYPDGKPFDPCRAIIDGFLKPDTEGLEEKNEMYKSVVLIGGSTLRDSLSKAKADLKPYEQYLI